MFPPPLPLCVEREPERMAVSAVVRGAYESKDRQPIKLMTKFRQIFLLTLAAFIGQKWSKNCNILKHYNFEIL